MDYIRQTLEGGRTFICFDEDELEFGREYVSGEEPITEEEVTIDPNNCVKYWTYDNEDQDKPDAPTGEPFIFANNEDANDWLEVANGDGHANNPYYWVVVTDGVEAHYYDEDN